MVETISRDELKAMMDREDEFFLVEALDERYYQRSHLPGAINLPPKALDRAEELLPDKEANSSSTAALLAERSPRRSPVSWRPGATRKCASTLAASRTGRGPSCRPKGKA